MSALAAMKPTQRRLLEFAERSRPEPTGEFKAEMEHAQHPAKQKQVGRKLDDESEPPPPDAKAEAVAPEQKIEVATPIAITGAEARTAPQGLEALIAQSAADAVQQVAAASVTPMPAATMAATSPLEQAVHDLISEIGDQPEAPEIEIIAPDGTPAAPVANAPIDDREAPEAPAIAHVREAAELPEQVPQSHVHLVIDDGERIVVTVAVRGDNVLTHIRGGDDATQAALARNAASLDDAMRARGLQLTDFHASPDDDHRRDDQPPPEREQRQPKFTLEDKK